MKIDEKEENEYKQILKKAANKINELNGQLEEINSKKEIAVIGYSCRFPGGANNSEEFWKLLSEGFDAVTEISEDRFNINDYFSIEKKLPGKIDTRYASFLDGDIKNFDNVHFEISANEAMSIDPQHKLLLEVSWESMENAGLDISKLKGSKTGVFIGQESFESVSAELLSGNAQNITPYTLFGVMPTSAAGRISYFYDFKGPAVTCDTACSSSLVALNMAVDGLRNGQCDMAIVGGVNLILGPESFIGLSQIQALSPDGRCKTFDASADGFGRGEGCGIVILKRAIDAKKDGNTIEALIRSVAVGQDGKSNGFYAPNGLAEQNVMSSALKAAGLSADDVDYIEAHGTGTTLGDFIEAQAIREAYKSKKNVMLIGSVKSNFGHLEAAAGMASLIKILLSIKHKQLPPSIHFNTPNENIDWDKLKVVSELTEWNKTSGKRRAGISSYGISGTLAHVIVEEPESIAVENELSVMPCNIVTLSAKSTSSLKKAMKNMQDYLSSEETLLNNVAYSSNITRSHLTHRYAVVGNRKEEMIIAIEDALNNEQIFNFNSNEVKNKKNKIAFLFTGQGSIYSNIAKQFYDNSKEFKESFDVCEKSFCEILGISIKKAIFIEEEEKLSNPIYSQPIIFSVEYALTKVWDTIGIKPDVVIGHSIGEYAAACYAGLISLDDAIKMIALRGKLMDSVDAEGKMVGVLTDVKTIEKAIAESGCRNVSIAAINASRNVTISGKKDEIDTVLEVLHRNERVFVNDLKLLHPYHSVIMKQYEKSYLEDLKDITFAKLNVKMISCVTGMVETENVLGTKTYWSEHLSKAVNYQAAIEESEKLGVNVFIEIGGNATLSGLAEQCLQKEDAVFVPSLRKGVDDYRQLLTSLKTLYLNGIELDWNKFYGTYEKEKVLLPNYPFQRKKLWKDFKIRNTSIVNNNEDVLRDGKGGTKVMVKESIKESNYTRILSDIIEMIHMITGMEREEIAPDKELFAFGLDSLLLASLGKQVKIKYNLELSLGQLFSSLNTLDKIAMFISENCDNADLYEKNDDIDVEKSVVLSSTDNEKHVYRSNNPAIVDNTNYVENEYASNEYETNELYDVNNSDANYSAEMKFANILFENQFEIMREQINIFKRVASFDVPSIQIPVVNRLHRQEKGETKQAEKVESKQTEKVESKQTTKAEIKQTAELESMAVNKQSNPTYYVPYKKLKLTETSDLESLQLKYVKNIEKKYSSLTKKSKSTTQKYRNVYASNRNSAGFRPIFKEMLYQIIAEKGKGSKLIDIDGNELIDVTMGFGVNLFGHGPEFVKEALRNEIENGMPLGPMGRLAGEVARQISELTGVERVFFCNSGTEADMFAVRLARAVTRKNKVVCFKGAFHGTYDGFLGVPSYSKNHDNSTLPMAPGITDNAVKDVILLEYNNEASLKYIEEHHDVIAAVITEPVQSRRPDVQPREFLHKLRKVTEENNVALIFDEIITGFRIAVGGAQEYFGVQADIVTYGKVIGGGMPIGVVSGKGKYLDSIDGGMWRFGDDSVPPCDENRTFVAGTFCHHPLAMAATDAVLKHIKANKDTIYDELNNKTSKFVNRMNTFFEEENVPLHIHNFGSLFRFNITLDREIFYYGLLEKGLYVWEGRNCFFSTEHTEEDIEKIVSAVKETTHEMKEAGYFGNFTRPTDPNSGTSWRKDENDGNGSGNDNSFNGNGGKSKEFPMSIIQQRLYSHMLMTESDPYDIVSAYLVNEKLNISKIEDVVNKIIKRHEILRTVLYLKEGEYKQRVLEDWDFKVREITQSEDMEMNELISQSISKFDLSKAPLLEILLITTLQNNKIIVFHFHHTVSDGMSMDLFVHEFSQLYKNKELSQLKMQYKDYVTWEQNYLSSDELKRDEEYWIASLADIPKITAIPYDYSKPSNTNYPGNTMIDKIDSGTLSALKEIARNNSASLFMVLLSAVNVLLYKTTRENEIAVSTPVTNRFDGGFEDCIGMFTNIIILKNQISTNESFEDLLKNVKRDCLQSYRHINYPYNQLVKKLNLTGQNAFSTEFVYENVGGRSSDQTGLKLENITYIPLTQEADITFELLECNGVVDVFLRFRTDLFKEASIKRLLKRFLLVIDQIARNSKMNISNIETITDTEKNLILGEFNNTYAEYPSEKTVVELFEEQVKKTPNNIAVVFEEEQLTYSELNEKANSIALKFREMGVKPDDFVAIIARKSVEMIIGVCGILKSGAAYVPIDESYPKDRIKYILEDCKPKVILLSNKEVPVNVTIPCINLYVSDINVSRVENLEIVNTPNNLIYVIYTSGTTGKPKGSQIEHKSVVRLVKNTNYISLDKDTTILQTGDMSFDASTFELWGALLNGGKLILVSKETVTNPIALKNTIETKGVNTLWLTSTLFNQMIDEDATLFHSLSYLLIGGEKLSEKHVRRLKESNTKVNLINGYGPTENTTFTTTYHIPNEFDMIPIGSPISNTQVYILNEKQLCGIGVPGEICIMGDGLSRGYLNNPELTSKKFIENPFGEGKMYRSGDLARWLPDGNIEYLGRIDEQVKIRGYRIELEEIESAIRSISNVINCAVIVRTSASSDKSICAYIVSNKKINVSEIREKLSLSMPQYMIPTYIMQIDSIPITRNGKLDKRALPEIEAKIENEYIAPRNETEETLCNIFGEILGVEKVGIRDSFFDLGGHSLRATRLVNQIEEKTGYKVALKEVFSNPTVEKLAMLITGKEVKEYSRIPKAEEKEYYPMSSMQKRTYLICQINRNGTTYNMPGTLKLMGEVQPDAMKAAFQKIIDRHEILRTEFLMVDGEPVQRVRKTVDADYEYVIDKTTSESEMMSRFVRPFDLSKAPLVRIMLVQRADCHILMIDTHHIISDGMSMETFTREITALYNGEKLEPLTRQYRDYSEWMRTRDMSAQKEYWVNEFNDEIPVLDIPLDYSRPQEQSYKGGTTAATIHTELGIKIKELARNTGTTEYMIFLSSAMVLLSKYSRQEDIVIGSPISGRTHKDTENMLGMFVNTLAMRGKPEGKKSYLDLLTETKISCLKAYENQEYPFEELVEAVEVRRDMSRNPLFDVMFAFQNNEKEEIKFSKLNVKFSEFKSNIAKFDLSFDIKETKDSKYAIELEYCSDLFKTETAERILKHYVAILEQLTAKPDMKLLEVEVITAEEKVQILKKFNNTWTEYPREKSMVELFEEQVRKTPDNIAVVFEEEQLTYWELNAKANSLALKLREMGVKPDEFVAIIARKSVEMIIGICGILKSGAAYVPIDESYPKDRIQYILDDCKPKVILLSDKEAPVNVTIACINLFESDINISRAENLEIINTPNNLIYAIYTSGTTGKPKGSLIEHKSVIRLVKNTNYISLDENTTILQTGALSFDASTFELWGTLLNGGKLILVSKETVTNPIALKNTIETKRVNTLWMTSTLFNHMIDEDPTLFYSLSYLLIGGEKLSEKHVRRLKESNTKVNLINGYGPTENTTFTTTYHIPNDFDKISIGTPISNTQVYILNEKQLCGVGVPGEICILGDGLSRGYLNNLELTSEKFINNPFGEGKMYRSGDLARWLPDGNIDYLGRIDEQVKIRGFRIELEEIESAIRSISGVVNCAVIVRTSSSGDKAICAYIVSNEKINVSEIREKLSLSMPQYMIPTYIMQIDSIPITRNGKLDKRALPEIEAKTENEYIAPRNDREIALCKAFEEVLEVEKVGIKDSFFELGGDSLKAIRLISKVRDFGYSVTVQHIMQYQIVGSISLMMNSIDYSLIVGDTDTPLCGEVPLGAIQRLFVKTEVSNPNHFNMSVMLESFERISEEAMRKAISAVVQHHDMLRVVFKDGRQVIKKYDENHLFEFKTYDLKACLNHEDIRGKIENYILESQRLINLVTSPLVSVTVFNLKDSDHIHICINHFVVDVISMRIITEDILTAYYYSNSKEAIRLPQKTASYSEWVLRMEEYANTQKFQEQEEYWKNINDQVGKLALPVYGNNKTKEIVSYMSSVELHGLSILVNKVLCTNMNNLLMATVAKAVCSKYSTDKIAINVEGHGRYDRIDNILVDRTVGWFTSMYPLIFKVEGDFNSTLLNMSKEIKLIPDSGIGYLLTMNKIDISNINIPQITINYLGNMDASTNSIHNIKLSEFSCGYDMDKMNFFLSSMSVNVNMDNDIFNFNFVYDQSLWSENDIKEIFSSICEILVGELNNNNAKIEAILNSKPDQQIEQLIKVAEQEMERYELEVISNTEFTDYPLTGIQRVSYEIKSTNVVIVIPFFDKIEVEKFSNSWRKLHVIFDVLRSSISISDNSEFIRIYGLSNTKIPFVDISQVSNSMSNEIIDKLLEGMDCFEQECMYTVNKLSSKILLLKLSDTSYRLLLSCSHLIFDRFSTEVLKNKLVDIYYGNGNDLAEYSYKNYYGLLRNEHVTISEDEIIERLGLDHFYKVFQKFYKKNKNREFETFIYEYSNSEKWAKLTEKEMLVISQNIFVKAMQFIFKDTDIPIFTLHISRKNKYVNLFEYIGEFLDVLPICISHEDDIIIEDEIQEKFLFLQENNLYISSLFYSDCSNHLKKVRKMLSEIHKMSKQLLVYNNTGILKSSNNLIINSDKYRIFYNVMSVVVNNDGIFMNVPIDSKLSGEIKEYLDSAMEAMIDKY